MLGHVIDILHPSPSYKYINSFYVFISVPQKSGTTKTHDMAFGMKAGPETAVDFQEQQLYLEV